jgi:hypothetical protein
VFIKDYQAQVCGVVIFIMLLAGFVPLLQVMFFALLEDLSTGLTRCERSGQNSRIPRRDPYHVVSNYWVAHRECFLMIADLQIVLPRAVYRSYWL